MRQTSFRISEETALLIAALSKKLDRSKTYIIELAVRVLARREGVDSGKPQDAKPQEPQ